MRVRVLCVLTAVAALLPGAAAAGVCSPLSCAPSQSVLAHGSLLAFRNTSSGAVRVLDLRSGHTRWRLPGGVSAGRTLVHQDGALLTWYDLTTGARIGDAVLQTHARFALVGLSQDGRRAVVARTQHSSTTFVVVSPRVQGEVDLPGNAWSFDALAGDRLFLVHRLGLRYEVRVARLPLGGLEPRSLVAAQGTAWSRIPSADGRYLFTLYVGAGGRAMLHVLDTQRSVARCIDLPGGGDANAALTYTLVLDPEARSVWAVSPGYGRVVHVDVAALRIDNAFRFDSGAWNTTPAVAVMAPDGERIAVSDAYHTWFVVLARRTVLRGPTHVAIALGWSPDQSHLWAIGERSRVSSLVLR
jgi:hypothetical protein